MMPATRTVLISEPSALAQVPFVPYVSAVLKSWWRRNAESPDAFEWLDPIYLKAGAEELLAPYDDRQIDVLGLSCYTWNWALQCQLARLVKARNPECLVVAGGPHPDYKNPAFFREHPEIDVVVVKDGEIPFAQILDRVAAGSRDFGGVPGLDLPERTASSQPLRLVSRNDAATPAASHVRTAPSEVPRRFDHSPYLDEAEYYERLAQRHGPGTFNLTWETNRGCPYSCSFCDWGSSTMSRIRAFDLERVHAEAEWIGRMRPAFVFVADANFGILPRDMEIADALDRVYRATGFPKSLYYSPAKNHPDRTVELALKFAGSGIVAFHTLSIQHTHPEVLACVDRSNIKIEKQREIVRRLLERDVPLEVQLIVGLPGDSPDRWKACLAELMDWGVHQEYIVFPFSLLPNAPAADETTAAKWQLQWVDRDVAHHQSVRPKDATDSVLTSRIVVSTHTYSPADWVEMRVYTAFVQALHNCSLTRLIAIYLHFTHGVSYDRFYRLVIDDLCRRSGWLGALRQQLAGHYQRIIDDPTTVDDMPLDEFPALDVCVDPSRWLFVKLCRQFDRFFADLGAFLGEALPSATNLASAVDYQKQLMVLPDYRRKYGKTVPIGHDWISYFATATRLSTWQRLDEPAATPGAVVDVRDGRDDDADAAHFDWGRWAPNDERRWMRWFEQTVLFRRAASRSQFVRLQLRQPAL